jgi:small nuclear ribonucleoprotein (snRNP)-like protein
VLRKVEFVALVVFLGLASAVYADQITLKNGDHLSGTVVKSDGKTLVLHTEFAGDVTVQFAAITQITTDKPLHVALKDGQTVVGPISTSDGKIEVTTKTAPVETPKDSVVAIRNDADQVAYEKTIHPGSVGRLEWGGERGLFVDPWQQPDRKSCPWPFTAARDYQG